VPVGRGGRLPLLVEALVWARVDAEEDEGGLLDEVGGGEAVTVLEEVCAAADAASIRSAKLKCRRALPSPLMLALDHECSRGKCVKE
jgi:hypothetical protein